MKTNYYIAMMLVYLWISQMQALSNPFIVSSLPVHNALNVAPNTGVNVTFDTSMNTATFTNSTVRINGSLSGLHTSVFNYNSDLRRVTITPNTSFKVGEVVTVTLTRGIKSIAGDSLSSSYSWQFTIKTNASSGFFQLSSTVGVGNNPWFIAAGDFDKDGAIDLAVANNNSNTVSILRNDGTGSFSLVSTVIVGISPSSITAADLNGDGYTDLATTNIGSGTVSILRNNGNGTFSETSVSSGGNDPWEVVAVDVNGDGALDLAVTNYSSNTVTILRNNGSGTFTLFSNVSVGNVPYSIVPADWDEDDIMDLAVTNSVSNTVSILKNNGNGVFTQASTIAVGNWPLSATALDIDGDGVMDLAVSNLYSDSISILKNNGSGVLSLTSTIVVGNYPAFKAAADIDGDGDLDLVIPFSGGINILQNNGSGTFSEKSILSVGTGSLTRMVLAVDVDGDGRLDLVGVNQGFNSISIFKPRTKNALIRLSSASLSFGPVANGSNKSIYLKIYNDGIDSSLIVTNITSSNSVFTVDRTSLTIPPLSYDSILVLFSPTTPGITYNYSDSLMIASNDTVNPIIKVSLKAIPISIWDVPNDHGKQVYIKWLTMGSPITLGITQFGIYRYDDSIWTDLTTIPVLRDSIYQIIAPTLIDSTGTNPNYWSTFRVIAYTANPKIYTVIGPDSGYSIKNISTGIMNDNSDIPESFGLSQNYPNPFNPSTTIRYALPTRSQVRIRIFNVLGQVVSELVNNEQAAGYQSVSWNANVASGLYFYRIEATNVSNTNKHFVDTKKMILLK
jgi:hypothetical protein